MLCAIMRLSVPRFFPFLALVFLSSCAPLPFHEEPADELLAYVPSGESDDIVQRFAPVVVVASPRFSYNQIGSPSVTVDALGEEHVSIDTDKPAIYVQKQSFQTEKAGYTNLIYRFHFPEVPFSLYPFYLTAGKNGGLIFVVTVDEKQEPVLFTTAHTCGCFLAFVPTSLMASWVYPDGWNPGGQDVYGVKLPGVIQYPATRQSDVKPVLFIADGSHRIIHIAAESPTEIMRTYPSVPIDLQPVGALKNLTAAGYSASFFFEEGFSKGYVKGSEKFFERLLMSWWVFDWHVGQDKDYGPRDVTGTPFYTSIKFWARTDSDMWPFARFLEYYGWDL